MISISHWGMFLYEPRTLIWPHGIKTTMTVEELRAAALSAGFARVIIDKADLHV